MPALQPDYFACRRTGRRIVVEVFAKDGNVSPVKTRRAHRGCGGTVRQVGDDPASLICDKCRLPVDAASCHTAPVSRTPASSTARGDNGRRPGSDQVIPAAPSSAPRQPPRRGPSSMPNSDPDLPLPDDDDLPEDPEAVAEGVPEEAAHMPAAPVPIHETDLGNAARLVRRHGQELRYCFPQKKWYAWDGTRWRRDDTGEIFRRAKDTVRAIYTEAGGADDPERRSKLATHAMRSEAEAKIAGMVALARSEPDIPVMPAQLDRDPWLFSVANGTLELRTGTLREHRRGDLITKLAPVTHDPEATCPRWLSFLDRVIDGNAAVIHYLQKAIGYTLTGDVSEQALFFQNGGGSNGKSTVAETVKALMGDYAMQAAPGLLTVKKGERHPTELADLAGARFVSSVEVDEGRALDEERLKALTGGEHVKGRRMREDFHEFAPSHKLWLSANHKPTIRGGDHAIWRRIKLIPFTVTIPDAEQDHQLKDKLRAELSGILNWALEGCLAWQLQGLEPPPEIRAATGEYRTEQDIVAPFLADRCRIGPDEKATANALYFAYRQWCTDNGEKAMTQRRFGNRLKDHGLSGGHVSGGSRWWHGVGLSNAPQIQSNADEVIPV